MKSTKDVLQCIQYLKSLIQSKLLSKTSYSSKSTRLLTLFNSSVKPDSIPNLTIYDDEVGSALLLKHKKWIRSIIHDAYRTHIIPLIETHYVCPISLEVNVVVKDNRVEFSFSTNSDATSRLTHKNLIIGYKDLHLKLPIEYASYIAEYIQYPSIKNKWSDYIVDIIPTEGPDISSYTILLKDQINNEIIKLVNEILNTNECRILIHDLHIDRLTGDMHIRFILSEIMIPYDLSVHTFYLDDYITYNLSE